MIEQMETNLWCKGVGVGREPYTPDSGEGEHEHLELVPVLFFPHDF